MRLYRIHRTGDGTSGSGLAFNLFEKGVNS
jgi:hypothetical protein